MCGVTCERRAGSKNVCGTRLKSGCDERRENKKITECFDGITVSS